MTEPKPEAGRSWWTTLPGVLTGVAAVLTALAGLMTAASPYPGAFGRLWSGADRPPTTTTLKGPQQNDPLGATTTSPAAPRRVGEVWIGNLEIRRSVDRGTASIDLYYRVSTGAGFVRHDPTRFVRMVSDGRAVAPSWAPPEMRVPAHSSQDIRVVFNTAGAGPLLFRFGEDQTVEVSLR